MLALAPDTRDLGNPITLFDCVEDRFLHISLRAEKIEIGGDFRPHRSDTAVTVS